MGQILRLVDTSCALSVERGMNLLAGDIAWYRERIAKLNRKGRSKRNQEDMRVLLDELEKCEREYVFLSRLRQTASVLEG